MRTLPLLLLLTTGCYRLGPDELATAKDRDGDGVMDSTYGGPDCQPDDIDSFPGADEVCDGIDNDCDDEIDEDDALDALTWYADGDTDGYGDETVTRQACAQPSGYVSEAGDCDDGDDALHPETWWFADSDGDGYGDEDSSVQQCEEPSGHVLDDSDCDDERKDVNPSEDELCDEVDHDCDGSDGFEDEDSDGWPVCKNEKGEYDCDDGDAEQYPGADEYCNGEDDDCDVAVDENDALDASTWYADSDGDGWGDGSTAAVACDQPTGHVALEYATDCDDDDAAQYPGADEYCNEEDDDCDGDVDEWDAVDATTWYFDFDEDGYGDDAATDQACEQLSGYVAKGGDCDDEDPDFSPGAEEYCDGIDTDCDGNPDYDLNVGMSGTTYKTITDALAYATAGDRICVLDGTYYETVNVNVDVLLEGQSRDGVVIDANGDSPVLGLTSVTSAEIKNLTLTGGEGGSGTALYSHESDATFSDVLIHTNSSTGTTCYGGMIYQSSTKTGNILSFDGLEIRDNTVQCSDVYGGIIYLERYGGLIMDHLRVTGNSVRGDGVIDGIFYTYVGEALITNAIIAGNGIQGDGPSVDIRSGLFNISVATFDLTNAVIYANHFDADLGTMQAGVLRDTDGGSTLTNVTISSNIFADGTVPDAQVAMSDATFSYCNFYHYDPDAAFSHSTNPLGQTDTIEDDPEFSDVSEKLDSSEWDFTLQSSSALINAGNPAIRDTDGSTSDIGAYGGPNGDSW